jgi:uncharacterized protein YjbI with pentapeptide repeats
VDVVLEVGVMTAEELLARYTAGERDFRGAALREIVLQYGQLGGIDLSNADLICADLSGCGFQEANLSGANLRGADLSGCSFRKTNLQGADCRGTLFIGSNLSALSLGSINLERANLSVATLIGVDLKGTNLEHAIMVETNLKDAINLNECSMYGAFLLNTTLPDGTVEVGPKYR